MKNMCDKLPFGIYQLDKNKRCVYINDTLKSCLDLTTDIMNSEKKYDFIHVDDREIENKLCNDFLENNVESESICRIEFKTGMKWVKHTRNLIKDLEGNIMSYIVTIQDVDNLKRLEQEILESKRQIEKEYVYKSSFLASMSHEIRTPLNGILGMLTLLEDTEINNEQKEYINMIKECSSNLMTIINDILDYSKLDAGKMTLDLKPFNLKCLVDSINDILLSRIYENKLTYTFSIDDSLPEDFIGDANRIKQILLNLLSNAIKFTDCGGKIHLKVSSETKQGDIVTLRFSVVDTGCGISEEYKEKIFESFSQIDNSKKVYQGTGLGLAIAKSLVDLMNGKIWLNNSIVNCGSEFCFYIPLKVHVEDKKPGLNTYTSVLSNLDVLILDDNLQNRLYLSGLCHKWGMTPHPFGYPQEALLFTKKKRYDIGLIDMCMPNYDGLQFAKEFVSQNDYNKNVPLIALSSIGDKIKSFDNFFCHHIIKPVSENKLKKECLDAVTKSKNKNQNTEKIVVKKQIDIAQYRNIHILVAEDNYTNQKVILGFLHKIGFENVYLVENGLDCLEFLKKRKVDICFIDIKMPVLNGVDLLLKIKHNNKEILKVPYCIALTAYSLKNDHEKFIQLGFNDYIAKPIDFSVLYNSLHNYCTNYYSL